MSDSSILFKLFDILEKRKKMASDKSYVASLMKKGTKEMNKKIIEETIELCQESIKEKNHQKDKMIYEIVDLLFHVFVLASYFEIRFDDLLLEFSKRFATSGLEEKQRRK